MVKIGFVAANGWAENIKIYGMTPSGFQFMEHAAHVFPVQLIRSCEDASLAISHSSSADGVPRTPNPLFVGIDIGRRKDLTVCWTLERIDGINWTREILILENTPFDEQEDILAQRLQRARYAAIDSTGLGGPISEHLAKRLGDYKLDAVNFTNDRKRELFSRAKKAYQSQKVRIPANSRLRDDLASIQRIVTPQGLVKFIAARTRDGHADRATALALALHAAAQIEEGRGLSDTNLARIGANPNGT